MRNIIRYIAISIAVLFLTAFETVKSYILAEEFKTVSSKQIESSELAILHNLNLQPIIEVKPTKTHINFLHDIAMQESSNNYKAVNRFGYMGKYQFGKATLRGLGYKVTTSEFLNNPTLQEEAMNKLLKSNKNSLNRYIKKYEGKTVHGVYITESGILAAAHLGGEGNVRRFFRTGEAFSDGNKVKITTYMTKFSAYKLHI